MRLKEFPVSEKSTHETPDARSFEGRVFARSDALDARFDSLGSRFVALESRVGAVESKVDHLEEKVDRRLQEARPIWEAVQSQLERLNSKIDILITDFYEVGTDIARLDKRVSSLEGQRTQ
jgi:predicted  nucleic acid-binding Zn-ribbon protein